MAVRRWWERIRLRYVNLALYLVLAGVALGYPGELRWSWNALPQYMNRSIPSPQEHRDYRAARRIIRDNPERLAEALPLLERSIAVDPNAKGYYWLGRYYLVIDDDAKAAEAFENYLEIDPVTRGTYLYLAWIYDRAGRRDDAIEVLRRGRSYFAAHAELYRPRRESVPSKFNLKAEETYDKYRASLKNLDEELQRLE